MLLRSVRPLTGPIAHVFAAMLLCLPAPAQQAPARQEPQDEPLSISAHLVNVDVMVKDKKGKFLADLKPEEFVVTENGVPQTVEFFDPPSLAGPVGGQAAAGGPAPTVAPGAPHNIISLVLDARTTDPAELKRVADGTMKYIRERVAPTDLVAVFSVSTGLRLLQSFTGDKTKLVAAVATGFAQGAGATASESREIAGAISNDAGTLAATQGADATGARSSLEAAGARAAQAAQRSIERFYALRSQLSVADSRPVLAALAAISEAQRNVTGKKIVVLFSQGFVTASMQDWQVQGLVDIANKANVAIYIIDSGGLRADAPVGTGPAPRGPLDSISGLSSQESRIRAVGGETVFDRVRHEGVSREQEILYRISGDTGGAFIKNTNDVTKGLERIDSEVRARYTLGYYSTNPTFDGAFRKLKIEVRRPGVEVVARPGYYAIPAGELVPLSAEDRKLLADFDAAAARPGLPVFAELTPFRGRDGRFVVPLTVEVPPSALKVETKGDARQMQLEVLGIVRDKKGGILTRLGGNFDVKLNAEQFAAIEQNNVYFRQDVELDPGAYTLELVVRDRLSGKTAARRESLELPLAGEEFAMSGVALSRLAMPTGPQQASDTPGDVFTAQGVQIRPSPSRTFRATDNLIIFFELYNAAAPSGAPGPRVDGSVTLVGGPGAAKKRIEFSLKDVVTSPVPHLTVAKYIRLGGLAPGSYSAKIEAKDSATGAVMTRTVPFTIVQ